MALTTAGGRRRRRGFAGGVWINVTVDGGPQYGDMGSTLPAGSVVWFTGVDVKIQSGKAWATFISIDGRNLGPMGAGVATREFSSQTSP